MPQPVLLIGQTVLDLRSGYRTTLCEYIHIPAQGLRDRNGQTLANFPRTTLWRLANNVPTWPEEPTRWRYPHELVASQPNRGTQS